MKELFERCLKANYIHTADGTDYAIEIEGDTLYLLFECSDDKEDWLKNFDFLPEGHKDREETPKLTLFKTIFKAIWGYLQPPKTPYKNSFKEWKVHRGFLRAWKSVRDDIETYIAERLNTSHIKKIKVIGYSHGAALAVLATEDLEYLYGDIYEITGYGFGTPRVLWGIVPEEVRYRLRNFKAYRNIPDIVTHVPPMLFGFRNIGLVKIGKKGKYNPIKAHYASAYRAELPDEKGE